MEVKSGAIGIIFKILSAYCFIISNIYVTAFENSTEGRLYDDIFTGYKRFLRPIKGDNYFKQIVVAVSFTIYQVESLNEKDQKLTVHGYMSLTWKDDFLTWNVSNYKRAYWLVVPAELVWLPEITAVNSVLGGTELKSLDKDTRVRIYSDGTVLWILSLKWDTTCAVDLTDFPYDNQTCEIHYANWMYTASLVNFTVEPKVSTSGLLPSLEWAVTGTHAWTEEKMGKTCVAANCTNRPDKMKNISFHSFPDKEKELSRYNEWVRQVKGPGQNGMAQPQNTHLFAVTIFLVTHYHSHTHTMIVPLVKVKIHLKRDPTFFELNVLVPSMLLSILMIPMFVLPVESGEKVSLGVTLMLAFSIFLLMMTEVTPRSGTTPKITLLILICTVFSGMSILLTVMIINIHHHSPDKAVPRWMKHFIIGKLGRILCCMNYNNNQEIEPAIEKSHILDISFKGEGEKLMLKLGKDFSSGLNEINKNLEFFKSIKINEESIEGNKDDWNKVARVMDRFFLCCYAVFVVCTITSVLALKFTSGN